MTDVDEEPPGDCEGDECWCRMPAACTPIPCPPFTEVNLEVTEVFDWTSGRWKPVNS